MSLINYFSLNDVKALVQTRTGASINSRNFIPEIPNLNLASWHSGSLSQTPTFHNHLFSEGPESDRVGQKSRFFIDLFDVGPRS